MVKKKKLKRFEIGFKYNVWAENREKAIKKLKKHLKVL